MEHTNRSKASDNQPHNSRSTEVGQSQTDIGEPSQPVDRRPAPFDPVRVADKENKMMQQSTTDVSPTEVRQSQTDIGEPSQPVDQRPAPFDPVRVAAEENKMTRQSTTGASLSGNFSQGEASDARAKQPFDRIKANQAWNAMMRETRVDEIMSNLGQQYGLHRGALSRQPLFGLGARGETSQGQRPPESGDASDKEP